MRSGEDLTPTEPEQTAWEIRQERLIKRAVRATMEEFGFTVDDVTEIQKDQAHLRRQRLTSETIGVRAIAGLIGSGITGLIALVILGLKDFFK